MPLTLTSPAFAEGEPIPSKYARDGENMLPPLKWTGAPDGVRSYLMVVEDPDAPKGTFRHCAVYNIPGDRTELPQSADTGPDAALNYGRNDFGRERYDGPEPPPGDQAHHYHFRLLALDVPNLNIPQQAGIKTICDEARKHVVEEAELIGTYER